MMRCPGKDYFRNIFSHNILICPFSPLEETRTRESFSDFSHRKLRLVAWLCMAHHRYYSVIKAALVVTHNHSWFTLICFRLLHHLVLSLVSSKVSALLRFPAGDSFLLLFPTASGCWCGLLTMIVIFGRELVSYAQLCSWDGISGFDTYFITFKSSLCSLMQLKSKFLLKIFQKNKNKKQKHICTSTWLLLEPSTLA